MSKDLQNAKNFSMLKIASNEKGVYFVIDGIDKLFFYLAPNSDIVIDLVLSDISLNDIFYTEENGQQIPIKQCKEAVFIP